MTTRRNPQATLRRALALLGVLLATSVARPSSGAADAEWFPMRAGSQWFYENHRDLTLSPEGSLQSRLLYTGRSTAIAEPAPKRVPNGFLIRQTTVQMPSEGGGIQTREVEWSLYTFGSELRLHASGATRDGKTQPELVYEPPLRILPTTTAGETWDAGTFRQGERSAKLRGKIIGTEDLDGTPAWSGCLAVQLEGEIAGSMTLSDVRATIESGHYERLLWFARGVGIVRDVTTVSAKVKLPDERHAEILQVSTERLVEHRSAK